MLMKINKENLVIFEQDGINIYMSNIRVDDLINHAWADQYDSLNNPEGYQRPVNKRHVQNIADYIRTEAHAILPTAIILAVDKEPESQNGEVYFGEKLRIVDGQHRIEAMKKVIEELKVEDDTESIEEFNKWEYPTIILILEREVPTKRFVEIRTFIDINKKGRKVPTDLADTNMDKILTKMDTLDYKSAISRVIMGISLKLNDNIKAVWYKCIRTGDDHNDDKTIGISAFSKSLKPLVNLYFKLNFFDSTKLEYKTEELDKLIDLIAEYINEIWIDVCDKWDYAFYYDNNEMTYRVDTDYSIQKGIGVYPMHLLLFEEYKISGDLDKSMVAFKELIATSTLKSEDWKVGSQFSYYNSASGFKKIAQMIKESSEPQ